MVTNQLHLGDQVNALLNLDHPVINIKSKALHTIKYKLTIDHHNIILTLENHKILLRKVCPTTTWS